MAQSKAHIRAANKYNHNTYDRININVPKGRRGELHAAAQAAGQSLNQFITDAIDERMARLGLAGPPFTPPPGEWCKECEKLGSRQYIPVGGKPEEEKPWCYEYGCELDAPDGKVRKCEKCAEKSRGA